MEQFAEVMILHCDICDEETWLPTSSLAKTLGYQSGSSNYAFPPFFACPHCNKVAQPKIGRSPELRPIPAEPKFRADKVLCVVLLGCDQTSCEAHIEVLATVKRGTTKDQVQNECRKWKEFGVEVQCDEQHRPARPVVVLDSRLEE